MSLYLALFVLSSIAVGFWFVFTAMIVIREKIVPKTAKDPATVHDTITSVAFGLKAGGIVVGVVIAGLAINEGELMRADSLLFLALYFGVVVIVPTLLKRAAIRRVSERR